MGNIKNPIHPLFDQNKKAMQQDQLGNKNLFFEQISNNRNEEKQSVHPYMLNKTYHVMNMQQ